MHTINHESIIKEFSRKLKFAAKVLILYISRNTCVVMLDIPVNSIFADAEQKDHTEVHNMTVLVWVAPRTLHTNIVMSGSWSLVPHVRFTLDLNCLE